MYYDEYRTCPECGKTKRVPSEFWWDARRCRKCIGRERSKQTEEKRNKEAERRRAKQKRRKKLEKDLDLKLAIPPRRYSKVERLAELEAESTVSPVPDVPRTTRDHVASALGVAGATGCLAAVLVGIVGLAMGSEIVFVLPVAAFVAIGLLTFLADKLGEPRRAALQEVEEQRRAKVQEIAESKLRAKLEQIDAEQFEYRRFYQTSDWRAIRDAVIERDGQRCRLCGSTEDLTVDHILPRSLYPNRALDPENLQVLCRSCNAAKGTTIKDR